MIRTESGLPANFTIAEVMPTTDDSELARLRMLHELAVGYQTVEGAVSSLALIGETDLVQRIKDQNGGEATLLDNLYTRFPNFPITLPDGSLYKVTTSQANLKLESEIAAADDDKAQNAVLWTMVHGFLENDARRTDKVLEGSFNSLLAIMGIDTDIEDPNEVTVHVEFDLERFVVGGRRDVIYLQAQDATH